MLKKKILLTCFLCLSFISLFSQRKSVEYFSTFANEEELGVIFDSLQAPLLVYNNMVFVMHSDCLIRAFGGLSNDRNKAGNANDRNKNGNVNDRNSDGDANDRNLGGGVNDRKVDGGSNKRNKAGKSNDRNANGNANDRNANGNANDRNANGEANDRNANGKIMEYECEVDKKGNLILYFKTIKKSETLQIYYNHLFFNNKFFKIKKV